MSHIFKITGVTTSKVELRKLWSQTQISARMQRKRIVYFSQFDVATCPLQTVQWMRGCGPPSPCGWRWSVSAPPASTSRPNTQTSEPCQEDALDLKRTAEWIFCCCLVVFVCDCVVRNYDSKYFYFIGEDQHCARRDISRAAVWHVSYIVFSSYCS